MNKEKVVEKYYLDLLKNIRVSIYKEIVFLLQTKFSAHDVLNCIKVDLHDGVKSIVFTNVTMFNFISKTRMYVTHTVGNKMLILETQVKTDVQNCRMRESYIISILMKQLNSDSSLKIVKMNYKNLSDYEISKLKQDNTNRQLVKKRVTHEIQNLKLSVTI